MKSISKSTFLFTGFIFFCFLFSSDVHSRDYYKRINLGDSLQKGFSLIADGEDYELRLTAECNLVLRSGIFVLWETQTSGEDCFLAAQRSDGNMVLYVDGRPEWATNRNKGFYTKELWDKRLGRGFDYIELTNNGELVVSKIIHTEF
ncbi:hypothetical protein [Pleionea sediminis]|uniref:hypothetical protein n=1 Tax=Pleionea sediminis TaxID=2569479 RepID=UPI0011851AA0|nr:hypothetical protein [Pleionea sediminis]